MAVAVRSSSSTSYASRTNTVLSAPSGLANNDILFCALAVGASGASPAVTPPTGFTELSISPTTLTASGFYIKFHIYWKRAASKSGNYTFTHSAASTQSVLLAISGAETTGSPIDAASVNDTHSVPGGFTTTALSVNTTTPDDLLLYLAHDWEGSGTLSPPTGFTEQLDGLVYAASKTVNADGPTGDVTQTNGNLNPGEDWAAFLVAIKPVAPTFMGPALRALTSTSYASGRTSTTVSAPSGLTDADILLATIFIGSSNSTVPTVTPPAGFNALADNPTNSTNDGGFYGKLNVYWKQAASESGSYTFTHTSASTQCVLMAIYGGAASPVDVSSINAVNVGGGTGVTVATGVTTTVDNDLLCLLAHDWTAGGGIAPPAGFTEHFENLVYTASKGKFVAGPTGNVTFVSSNPSGYGPWTARLVAIKPSGGALNVTVQPTGSSATVSVSAASVILPSTIVVRSLSSSGYGSRVDTVIAPPSGIANDDILLAFMFIGGFPPGTPTPPTGFTQIGSANVIDPAGAGFSGTQYVWWKRAASESGNYTFSHVYSDAQVMMLAIKNAKTSGSPIDVFSSNANGDGKVTTATGITTTANNDLVVYLASDWEGAGALEAPSGYYEYFDSLVYAATKWQYVAGATGNAVQTNGNLSSSGEGWGAWLVGVLEQPSGSPNVTVIPTGNQLTTSAGTVTATVSTAANPLGSQATASAGTVTVTAVKNITVSPTSSQATTSAGTVSVIAVQNITVTPTSSQATASAGTVTVSTAGNASVTLTGNPLTASVSSVSVSAGGAVSFGATGSAATASAGTVTVAAVQNVTVPVTTNLITASAGNVAVSLPKTVSAATNLATTSVGNVTVTTGAGAAVNATTNLITASAGNVTVASFANVTVFVTDNVLSVDVGSCNAAIDSTVLAAGQPMTISAGGAVGSISTDVGISGSEMTVFSKHVTFLFTANVFPTSALMTAYLGQALSPNWGTEAPSRRETWTSVAGGSNSWTPVPKDTPNDWT